MFLINHLFICLTLILVFLRASFFILLVICLLPFIGINTEITPKACTSTLNRDTPTPILKTKPETPFLSKVISPPTVTKEKLTDVPMEALAMLADIRC